MENSNRTIKLRAWNPIKNELEYWTLNDLCYHQPPDRPDICLQNWQEYTGLKDKNGKEIYEGDIVKIEGASNGTNNGRKGICQWSDDNCAFVLKANFLFNFLGSEDTDAKFEIIGNIYENPELLKA